MTTREQREEWKRLAEAARVYEHSDMHALCDAISALLAEVERLEYAQARLSEVTQICIEQEVKLARCAAWIEKAAEAMRGIGPGNHAPSCPCEVCGLARLADTRPRGLLERKP